jgi:serine/threonine protein kinase
MFSGAKDLVSRLLKKNPELRMPLHEVKEHPWIKAHLAKSASNATEVQPGKSAEKSRRPMAS